MQISRRTFLKASGVTLAGSYLALKYGLPDMPSFFEEGRAAAGDPVIKTVPTTCWIGKQDCGMLCRTVNGRVVKLEGDPNHPRNEGTLCPKGAAQLQSFYDYNRVKTPLIRTNDKGVPGDWREATWDEALNLVVEKIKEALATDPKYLIWQKGRSKAKPFYDKAFVKATGATKLHHGAFCSDAGYRALEYTLGTHAVLHPDFRHTKYLLSWGWNITGGGGNKFCWLTWPRQLVKYREKHGLKVVDIDPRLRSAAHFADEWLPIRPATDMALALAICQRLIANSTVDWEYLRKYTNAAYLVKGDGHFLRRDDGDGEKELVWDPATSTAVPFDTEGLEPALEGEFSAEGETVKPAFQLFKDYVADKDANWAAGATGLTAAQILKVADELGENAMIGATIEVEGQTLPYRPVAIMAYHMAQQELGFQTIRSMVMIPMLLGAIGAVGGQSSDFTWKIHKNYAGLNNISITEEPNIYLNKSKFYPINSNNSSVVAKVMADPAKYGVDYDPTQAVVLVHMANPLGSFPDYQANYDAYMKFKFVTVIDPWLSKTADLFADVVLPAATIEKYEGPISATDQYVDAKAMRLPPMDPLFQSKGEIDIYLDLCEKLGVKDEASGETYLASYLANVNKELKLDEEHKIDVNTKPTVEQILDNWSRMEELEGGLDYFRQNGVWLKGPVAATKYYGSALDPPYGGMVHRFYGESLLNYQEQMKALGAEEIYWQDYTPLPQWRTLTMEGSPSSYDLYLTSYHMIEFKQARTPTPLVRELAPEQLMEINPRTARAKSISDGDWVEVESHNAVTNKTRKVKVRASYRESIQPDTVAMPHHYGGLINHPWTKKDGPSPNVLFFTGEGYVAQTADQTYCVKVKVTPAGGGG